MSVWGKILGGAAGFAIGGPIGAILGTAAGHAVDKMRDSTREAPEDDATRRVAFTIGVIVLGAKMAKADGVVTKDEIGAFKEVFHIPQEEMQNVGRLFNQARRDAAGFEPYARQIARLFRHNPAVLEELIDGLFHIARADRKITADELEYLAKVAEIFGVSRTASDEEIKAAHRRLVVENHPDKLVAEGLPQEFVDLANEKLATINAAYDRIRGLRKPH
jgi:DnaJ like chaperone protein